MVHNYNSQRVPLILKEYGRNVQSLVDVALTVEDDGERQKVVQDIIDLMGAINPSLRNVDDFRHKLWDHIFMISDFQLKAESPYPLPEREKLMRKNKRMSYPRSNIKFRHYGKFVESLITKAIQMEDLEKRRAFTDIIGNYMKLVYQNWNRENVTDDVIKTDIKFLSNGILSLDDESNLDNLSKSTRRPPQNTPNRNNPNTRFSQNKNFRQNQNNRFGQNQNNNRNFKKRG
ncbi:MAG: DUF4290 domain-containing protein [Chitinophagales bacterium]|nr:DUF4290 domain-containing protein [Chitinophagales bacterium]